jgi:hypothetical protein
MPASSWLTFTQFDGGVGATWSTYVDASEKPPLLLPLLPLLPPLPLPLPDPSVVCPPSCDNAPVPGLDEHPTHNEIATPSEQMLAAAWSPSRTALAICLSPFLQGPPAFPREMNHGAAHIA